MWLAPDLSQGLIDAHASEHRHRLWEAELAAAARRDKQTNGGEAIEVGRRLVERGELGNGTAVIGDQGALAGLGAADHIGKFSTEFTNPECVHTCT